MTAPPKRRFIDMRRGRARHQHGRIEPVRKGVFRLHWYEYEMRDGKEHRVHRNATVGDGKMKVFEAEEQLRKRVERVNPITSRMAVRKDSSITLAKFIDDVWQPLHEGSWREESSRITYLQHLKRIKNQLGAIPLQEVTPLTLQAFINKLAKQPYQVSETEWRRYSYDLVKKCFDIVKRICADAVYDDYLNKDPAHRLEMPECRRSRRSVMEWHHYPKVLAAVKEFRDRLTIKVGSFAAVRPEELFCFRWNCLNQIPVEGELRWVLDVRETFYRGKVRPYAKTESSEKSVPLPDALAVELLQWRKETKFKADTDFIFANSKGNPMKPDWFVSSVLYPVRDALKLADLNFRVLRRSFATRALGDRFGDVKDVQRQLRHEKPDTTLTRYTESVDASVFRMLNAVYEKGMGEASGSVQ